MDKKALYAELAAVLQVPVSEMKPELILETCNWDSLAQVSVIMVLDSQGGVRVKPGDLAKCKTLGEIEQLLIQVP